MSRTFPRRDKLVSLSEAAALVPSGSRLALGGFGVYERPMAFTRELVRRQVRNLTVIGHVSGLEVDVLAGAGAVDAVETSYVGLERFGRAPNFARAVENGEVEFIAFSEQVCFDRFRASQAGLTFWPVIGIAGTDLVEGNPHIVPASCPITGRPYYAVSPAAPDVVVIHAGRADRYGNVAFPMERQLSHSLDIILAQSCDTVIVTVEEVVSPEELRRHPELVELPAFQIKAVVEAPSGAHPTSALGYYPADDVSIDHYLQETVHERTSVAQLCCKTEEDYQNWSQFSAWLEEVARGMS